MALITFDQTPAKGSTVIATIHRSDIIYSASFTTAEAYWQSGNSIEKAIVVYGSEVGNQSKTLVFDLSLGVATANANLTFSLAARDVFVVKKFILVSTLGEKFNFDLNLDAALIEQIKINMGDTTAPTINNSALAFGTITTDSIGINFYAAEDADPVLQYRCAYSTSNNIGSVTDIETNGTFSGPWTTVSFNELSVGTFTVSGLASNTHYYFNVIVSDSSGNKACYTTNNVQTMAVADPVVSLTLMSGTNNNVTLESGIYYINGTYGDSTEPVQATLQLNQALLTQLNSGSVWSLQGNGPEEFSNSSHVFIIDDLMDDGFGMYEVISTPSITNIVWDSENYRYTFNIDVSRFFSGGYIPSLSLYKGGQIKIRKDRLCGLLGCGTGNIFIATNPPIIRDTDGDGIADIEEPMYGTDKFMADTDAGGTDDGVEVFVNYTNPNDPNDDII